MTKNKKLAEAIENIDKIWICTDCVNTYLYENQERALKHHIKEHQN